MALFDVVAEPDSNEPVDVPEPADTVEEVDVEADTVDTALLLPTLPLPLPQPLLCNDCCELFLLQGGGIFATSVYCFRVGTMGGFCCTNPLFIWVFALGE